MQNEVFIKDFVCWLQFVGCNDMVDNKWTNEHKEKINTERDAQNILN